MIQPCQIIDQSNKAIKADVSRSSDEVLSKASKGAFNHMIEHLNIAKRYAFTYWACRAEMKRRGIDQ